MNELYWYQQYVKTPWMIGETAIAADNDSITYEEQKHFAEKTLKQAYDCGAMGYSWWQYKDVDWRSYLANFMGVVTRKGETKTEKSKLTVLGTPKPVADAFKKFSPIGKKEGGVALSNYYNYSQGKKCRMIGYLKDENNNPIQGGVVQGQDRWWIRTCHTITKHDGSFELLGSFPFSHWGATATLFSVQIGELLPDTARTGKDSIPTMNIGTLKLKKL
jgi:hypothetical protein